MAETSWTVGDTSSSETLTDNDHLYPGHVNELRTAINVLEAILDPDTSLLTSPVISSLQINDTTADHQYVFAVSELTADRTVTLPLLTGDDEFVFKAHTQTLTNKTLTSPVLNTGVSGTAVLDEDAMTSNSATKLATQQSIKAYVDSGTVTMTNKTLTSPVLTTPQINDTSADHQYIFAGSELTADRTVTLPLLTSNDEFVFKAHTQTLTNKTLTAPQINDTSADHQYIFAVSELTADRTVTLPLLTGNDDFVFEDHIQTLTNKTVIQKVTSYTPDAAGTATLDVTTGGIHKITMPAGNITIAISNEAVGQCFMIEITQDGTGSRTVTWFTTIKWAGGSAPTLTTTADKRDTFGFRVTGTDTYDGFIVGLNI